MPKPSIYQHRFYLLKFTDFDLHQKGFLPSLILPMTLTLCQIPASMNIDFAFSNLTEINPCWKRFVPSQIQTVTHLGRDSYLLMFTKFNPLPGKDA
jgi:hypothetical protein